MKNAELTSTGVRLPGLGCPALRLEYDFCARIGRLFVPALCCTDMSACIALFARIDPSVRRIFTFAGSEPDTIYVFDDTGWRSWLPPTPMPGP